MKKVKFNVMAVAAMAIAFSTFAFKASEAKKADLVWFEITQDHAPGMAIPPADANYLNHGTIPEYEFECSGSEYQCVSGFNPLVVDANNNLIGAPTPENDTRTRN